MTETVAKPPRKGTSPPVSREDTRRLRALTASIRSGQQATEMRAAMFVDLRERGHSLDAIATATGIHREQVRKSILRRSGDYRPDRSPE